MAANFFLSNLVYSANLKDVGAHFLHPLNVSISCWNNLMQSQFYISSSGSELGGIETRQNVKVCRKQPLSDNNVNNMIITGSLRFKGIPYSILFKLGKTIGTIMTWNYANLLSLVVQQFLPRKLLFVRLAKLRGLLSSLVRFTGITY